MSTADHEHREALERVYAGRLKKEGDFLEISTALFVRKIDTKMPPLPEVAFFEFVDGKVRQFRASDQPYSPLALSTRANILIHHDDYPALKKFAESQILKASTPGALPPEKRMETLRRTAMLVVEDLFEDPTQEKIEKSKKVVGSFVYVLMKDPKAYLLLSKLSSHDPYTLQHSVGTAVNCIILARKIGINGEEDLINVGMAGLLHDIGKVRVKKEIINKNGPLDELEWEEMRQHAELGHKIVKDNPHLSEETKRAILQHHETPNGTGYPHGLKGSEISIFARIVCLCDIYNALTTDRSYSKARQPFEAFQFIREKLYHKVDPELFKCLVLIYGGEMDGDTIKPEAS